ncbi:UNVERIFIED_CONTAM: Transposon TX1 uncharacterized protein [Sesamum radiatum]|uniref:Transposon TX1 uncharacterized protein n=1 Tax=Sesamum radiatum TaxID=300843 RepID=A0AAW2J103_SESRA
MLVNEAWLAKWPQSKYISTYPRTSDHSPLILQGQDTQIKFSMFRFENYMTKLPGFQRLVEEHWGQQINGTDMYILTRKLKAMKPILRKLRKTHGDLSHNVQQAALFLQKAQQLSQEFEHESILLQLEKCCRMIYCKATTMEINMLKQRAKLAWLKGGDNCSKIFFRKITARRASQRVYQIQNEDGHLLTDYTAVTGEFVNYFKKLFGGSQRQTQNLDHLQPFARYLISEDEATQIISPVQKHEIKEALADINEDSAPGPDGFSSGFFKASWDVIGEDVCRAVMEFFNHDRLLKQLNATLITLIPKVQLPTKVGDFRPIACCNVIYKIITKIMVKRMQIVLEKLVDTCQNAFVPGRSISDNVSLLKNYYQATIRKNCLHGALSRIAGWNQLKLTYAGRTQLIKTVLSSIHQYWCSVFILPKGVIKVIEAKLRNFLWKGGTESGGYKVAWEQVCKPTSHGGLGIRNIQAMNNALMGKHLWQVGDGTDFKLWLDPWHPDGTLLHRYPHGPLITGLPMDSPLSTIFIVVQMVLSDGTAARAHTPQKLLMQYFPVQATQLNGRLYFMVHFIHPDTSLFYGLQFWNVCQHLTNHGATPRTKAVFCAMDTKLKHTLISSLAAPTLKQLLTYLAVNYASIGHIRTGK